MKYGFAIRGCRNDFFHGSQNLNVVRTVVCVPQPELKKFNVLH